jgi:serine/threonine-protein kinase
VNVQLINVATGNADWSEEYQRDMSDVFQVQDDIARAIVGALRVRLTAGATTPVAGAGTRSVEAYDLYLRGRYFYERRTEQDFLKAAGLFKQAIAMDTSYARAYAGLSDTYALLGIFGFAKRDAVAQRATEAVTTALRLDSTSAEAYTSLGIVRLFYDWDWPGAQRALERAIALDPRYVPARLFHAWYFVAVNQLDSALSEAQRGAEIDPLSIIMRVRVATMLQYAGRQVEAIAALQTTLALDSTYYLALSRMAISSVAVNRCDDALRAITGVHDILVTSYVGYVLASCHRQAEARALASDLERHSSQRPAVPLELAATYAALGEKDKAFAWLERAYSDHSWPLFQMRVDLAFASLRSDPRFQAIVSRMRFPRALRHTSASVNGRGVLPSMSVKPYSFARLAATNTFPVWRSTSGSAARAATARPMNSADSELVMSSHCAASMTFSVRTRPG